MSEIEMPLVADVDPCPALRIPKEGAAGSTEPVGPNGEKLFYAVTPGLDPSLPCANCPLQIYIEKLKTGTGDLSDADIVEMACIKGEPHTITMQVVKE